MDNDNLTRYVGIYSQSNVEREFLSTRTVILISGKVCEYLANKIVVPDSTIESVMNTIFREYRTPVKPLDSFRRLSDLQELIEQTIKLIVDDVSYNMVMENNSDRLSAWSTVLGDFNHHGMTSHSKVKVRPGSTPLVFNVNY